MSAKPELMRDAVIGVIFEAAKKDRDILFISADLGAQALDAFRAELPAQFIHAGIAEQNMVDLASGLALSGKKVFLYAMAPFITARCYEQVKCVIASMNLPVTLIAVGVGLGYDHATLTHFTPEDIACMRALNGIEVLSPSDAEAARAMAIQAIENPAFRYIRLERQPQAPLYDGGFAALSAAGYSEIAAGRDVAIVATGYMTHRINPLAADKFAAALAGYRSVLTVEEQLLDGGMGSVVVEALADTGTHLPVKRLGMMDGFDVVNGNRDELHAHYKIDTPDIVAAAAALAAA